MRRRLVVYVVCLPQLGSVAAQLQCDPRSQSWSVQITEDATGLAEALQCTGGTFSVDWTGDVLVEQTMAVLGGTSLTITGIGPGAVADGGGKTALFYVNDGTLRMKDMQLINAYKDGEGAAVYSKDGVIVLQGTTVFANNRGGSSNVYGGGGAVYMHSSMVTSTGSLSFMDNTVSDYDGGALSVNFDSVFNASGVTEFVNNSAEQDGGAVRIGFRSNFSSTGHTRFISNRAEVNAGALFAADTSIVELFGTTVAMSNSAGSLGGAFQVSGSSLSTTVMRWAGDTEIKNNSAGEDGGALLVDEKCHVSWSGNMTFADNKAEDHGGAVAIRGDSELSSQNSTVFRRNFAGGSGGAVYSLGNIIGQTYYGVVFEFNSATIGGAVATYSTGPEMYNTYVNCVFQHNRADTTGGAMEASVGQDRFQNSSFVNNSAGVGGALRLSGTVTLVDINFTSNSAQSEGPAIHNIGKMDKMENVLFEDNFLVCANGEYLDYFEQDNGETRYETVCDGCSGWEDCEKCEIYEGDKDPRCFPALDHTSAKAGTTLQTLDLEEGYWRATDTSKNILECHNKKACKGGADPLHYCANGYMVPYCSVCQDGYAATLAFICARCSGSGQAAVLSVAMVFMVIAVGVVVYIVTFLVSTRPTETSDNRLHARVLRALPLASVKIIVVVWQILSQFSSVANVTYPDSYERFLKAIHVVNLDLGWAMSTGCVWPDLDFHDRLLFNTMGPFVILAILAVTYTVAQYRAQPVSDDAMLSRVRDVHMSALLLWTFFVYSSVSSTVFRMFACEGLDDDYEYLRADYRILCTGHKHRALQAYAGIMIAVYPIGIPLFYTALLYRLRRVLTKEVGDRSCFESARARSIADLWTPYRPECFYYEVVECCRRILLTGIVVFIYPGDAAQIAVTIVITFVFFVIFDARVPYKSPVDKWLSRGGHIVVFFSFFAALLYKVDVSNEREASQQAFGVVMVVVHVCLILAVLGNGVIMWHSRETSEIPFPNHCARLERERRPSCVRAMALHDDSEE